MWALIGGLMLDAGKEAHNFIENAVRYFALGHFGKSKIAAVASEECHDVGVHIETRAFRRDIVGHDQVGVFFLQLFASVLRDSVGFRCESGHDAIAFLARGGGQDIGIRLEPQREFAGGFLDFLPGGFHGPIVGHGCGKNS